MKIHILFKFVEGPWGGGNQFLNALRNYFRKTQVYEEDPYKADVILFNSDKASVHNSLSTLLKIKKKNNPVIINRIDGPINLRNPGLLYIDKALIDFDNDLCDGSILQSNWINNEMRKIGYKRKQNYTIIYNSSEPSLFYNNRDYNNVKTDEKIKIVANSWSSNFIKGFNVYKFLDENLDFNKFSMTFIGNTPVTFQNIKRLPLLSSNELAEKLREHDIFLTASKNDPCSNSLIEALHCGLPAVSLNSGGHPEVIKEAGEIFQGQEDVLQAIDKVADNLNYYRSKIDVLKMEDTGRLYYEFICKVKSSSEKKDNKKKRFMSFSSVKLILKIRICRSCIALKDKINPIVNQKMN